MGKRFLPDRRLSKEQTRPDRPVSESREWLASLSEFRAWFGVG